MLQFQTFSLLTDSQTLARPRGAFAPKNLSIGSAPSFQLSKSLQVTKSHLQTGKKPAPGEPMDAKEAHMAPQEKEADADVASRKESSIADGEINGLQTDNAQLDRSHGVEHVHGTHGVMHAPGDNLLVTFNGDHQYAAMPALRPRAGFPFDRGRQVVAEEDV